jgi:hypothetical protein
MTLQQKRRAMAEACPGIFVYLTHDICWKDTRQAVTEREWLYAVHLSEQTLTEAQRAEFGEHLAEAVGYSDDYYEGWSITAHGFAEIAMTTESQRIDAFLKVKGLWREGE